jgi:hypothetical protein
MSHRGGNSNSNVTSRWWLETAAGTLAGTGGADALVVVRETAMRALAAGEELAEEGGEGFGSFLVEGVAGAGDELDLFPPQGGRAQRP